MNHSAVTYITVLGDEHSAFWLEPPTDNSRVASKQETMLLWPQITFTLAPRSFESMNVGRATQRE